MDDGPLAKKSRTSSVNSLNKVGTTLMPVHSQGTTPNFHHANLITKFVTEDKDAADVLCTAFGASHSASAGAADGGGFSDFSKLLSQISASKEQREAPPSGLNRNVKSGSWTSALQNGRDPSAGGAARGTRILNSGHSFDRMTSISVDFDSNTRPSSFGGITAIGDINRQTTRGIGENGSDGIHASGAGAGAPPGVSLFLDVAGKPQLPGDGVARRDVQDTIRFLDEQSRTVGSQLTSVGPAATSRDDTSPPDLPSAAGGAASFRLPEGAIRRFLSSGPVGPGGHMGPGGGGSTTTSPFPGAPMPSTITVASRPSAPSSALPPTSSTAVNTGGGGGGGVGIGGGGGSILLLERFPELPMDWSLRRSITVTSREPWVVAEAAARVVTVSAAAAAGIAMPNPFGKASSVPLQTAMMGGESLKKSRAARDNLAPAAATAGNGSYSAGGAPIGEKAELAGKFLEALRSYRHPETPLDTASLLALRGSKALRDTVLQERLRTWRAALRNLYYNFRLGACHAFYFVQKEGRHPFAILFIHKFVEDSFSTAAPSTADLPSSATTTTTTSATNVGTSRDARDPGDPGPRSSSPKSPGEGMPGLRMEIQAIVSQSSRAMRGRMLAAGLEFSMPLVAGHAGTSSRDGSSSSPARFPQPTTTRIPERMLDHLDDVGLKPQQPTAVRDNDRGSLLQFRGPRAVHGLYEFLRTNVSFSASSLTSLSFSSANGGGGFGGGGGLGGTEDPTPVDLPVLLAPAPFEGAGLYSPVVKRTTRGVLTNQATGIGYDTSSIHMPNNSPLKVLQITGLIPPWTVRRLGSLFRFTQNSDSGFCDQVSAFHPGLNSDQIVSNKADSVENTTLRPTGASFHMAFESETVSLPLVCFLPPDIKRNAIFPRMVNTDSVAPECVPSLGGALSYEEYQIWLESDGQLLEGRAIKDIAYDSNLYTLRA